MDFRKNQKFTLSFVIHPEPSCYNVVDRIHKISREREPSSTKNMLNEVGITLTGGHDIWSKMMYTD